MVRQNFVSFVKHWDEITVKKFRGVQIDRYPVNHMWMLEWCKCNTSNIF